MTTQTMAEAADVVRDNALGAREALSVRRVFGDAYEIDGTTIIPVARVAGGGGGGGGGDEEHGGAGFGSVFRVGAQPIGVYEVKNGTAEWKPALDVTRMARGGQMLAGVIAVCVTIVILRRRA